MSLKGSKVVPQARRDGLIVETLPDEVLVYDTERHKAHCLNRTAAAVWRHSDGQTSVAELMRRLDREGMGPGAGQVVWTALEQLGQAHLLVKRVDRPAPGGRLSRREALRLLGAAAVTVPLVTTITAPPASANGTCRPDFDSCFENAECCSGCCDTGTNLCRAIEFCE
jgi:hypothetical protein